MVPHRILALVAIPLAVLTGSAGAETFYRFNGSPSKVLGSDPSKNGDAPPPPLGLAFAPAANVASAGEPASGGFEPANAVPPVTYSVSGNLPVGVGVGPDGMLQGTFLTPGVYAFTVTATDALDRSASTPASVEVRPPPPTISATSAPSGLIQGSAFRVNLAPDNGTSVSGWGLRDAPSYLSVTNAGTVSGAVPTDATSLGFTAFATDAFARETTLTQSYAVATRVVASGPSTYLKVHMNRARAVAAPAVQGGTAPYAFTLEAISGTPTPYTLNSDGSVGVAGAHQLGSWSFRVKATSASMPENFSYGPTVTVESTYELSYGVNPTSVVGTVGSDLSNALRVDSLVGNATYKLLGSGGEDLTNSFSGTCKGLSFSTQTGTVSGKATDTCSLSGMRVMATDVDGAQVTSATFGVTVNAGPPCYVLTDVNNYFEFRFNKPALVDRYTVAWRYDFNTTNGWYVQLNKPNYSFANNTETGYSKGPSSGYASYPASPVSGEPFYRTVVYSQGGSANGVQITSASLSYNGVAYKACAA